jgi:hypothetical protein
VTGADFTFTYHPLQRQRFRDGLLVTEWRARYRDLFDEKDETLARNQSDYHFYEWLSAVLLWESMGYTALVEGYIAKSHPRKRELFRATVPAEVFAFVDENQSGLPDLFVYAPSTQDWFFCEVKGGPDRIRPNQEGLFASLHDRCKKRVRLIRLVPFRS